MFQTKNTRFNDIFGSMEDHRINRTRLHPMENILFISLCAVISGCETWNEIEDFGHNKIEWLSRHLDMPNGIPSHDTFNRFFSHMDPAHFEEAFRRWVEPLVKNIEGDIIPIDGKSIRGAKTGPTSALHMVSAWSTAAGVTIGQLRTPDKKSEIVAVIDLLDTLFIEDATVTLDALHARFDTIEKIRSRKANYVVQVKRNRRKMYDSLQDQFESEAHLPFYSENHAHGRIEKRSVSVLQASKSMFSFDQWKDLRSVVKVERETNSGINVSYYITNLSIDAKQAAKIIRSHWGIENNLHWMLDVAFHEDDSQKRNENAVINFSALNKIALATLKRETDVKLGVKSKRLKAAMNSEYLEKILSLF